MSVCQRFNSFYLNNDLILNKNVNPISLLQFDTLIDYWQRRLPLNE